MSNAREFTECDSCRQKPGTPVLCDGCLANRVLIAELQKDAARYRWLRDNDGSESVAIENASGEVRYVFGEELDAAIDAAMEGE